MYLSDVIDSHTLVPVINNSLCHLRLLGLCRVSLLFCLRKRQLYRRESLLLPGHPMTAVLLGEVMEETPYILGCRTYYTDCGVS